MSSFHPRVLSQPRAIHMNTGSLTEVYHLLSRLFPFDNLLSETYSQLAIFAYQTLYGSVRNFFGRNFVCDTVGDIKSENHLVSLSHPLLSLTTLYHLF